MNSIQKSIVQKSIVALAVGIMVCLMNSAWAADIMININTASIKELTQLPGIGKVTANRIVAYREKNGQFKQKEDIQKIKGIGSKTFTKVKDLITLTDKK
jgi:competence protein ComEA